MIDLRHDEYRSIAAEMDLIFGVGRWFHCSQCKAWHHILFHVSRRLNIRELVS
jgi:hypothetical protein